MFLETSLSSWKTPAPKTFFNNVAGLSLATLLKRGSGTGVFLEFYEISKSTFLTEHLRRLLLYYFNNVLHQVFTGFDCKRGLEFLILDCNIEIILKIIKDDS